MKNISMEALMYFMWLLHFFSEQNKTDGESKLYIAKAGTFWYSDRIQKENSKVPILKIINYKNPWNHWLN